MNAYQDEFQRVIREFCGFLGIPDWEQIARNQHLDVGGSVVGLIHDEAQTQDTLCLFFDMGSVLRDAAFSNQLLLENATIGPSSAGYFALHPEVDRIIYCVKALLEPALTGEALCDLILSSLEQGRAALQALTWATSTVTPADMRWPEQNALA